MPLLTAHFVQLAEQVFLRPKPTYPWADIVGGMEVNGTQMSAVGTNTWRAFHRVNKPGPGAKQVFIHYFNRTPGATELVQRLAQIDAAEALDRLANRICDELRDRLLSGNIKPHQLGPGHYNKLRKPVDIYLESLVSMAAELAPHRARLTPLLRVPLDTWIFGHPLLFTDEMLRDAGLNRRSGFGDLKREADYVRLQSALQLLATRCAAHHQRPFHPIYLDLLWGDRYTRSGGNLFQLNP